ncbi:MAG: TrbG/VirB9 family P-type conjugative transfer protein [Acidobacteria bacterium]|nr:TrbG/VirB9 family P-type conjugative transfer protein [Acidobacteriota bacterium]
MTDPRSFHAESNGTIGIVTPLFPKKSTSVSIFTENDRLFVFNVSSEPNGTVDQLVIVEANTLQPFGDKVKAEAQKIVKERLLDVAQTQCEARTEQRLKQLKQQLLFSLNSNYEVRDQKFSSTRVVDDKIFTYIQLVKSQNRPTVYIRKGPDLKKLEPIKYTDEGDYYTVHRVFSLSERLYLKLGDETSANPAEVTLWPHDGFSQPQPCWFPS